MNALFLLFLIFNLFHNEYPLSEKVKLIKNTKPNENAINTLSKSNEGNITSIMKKSDAQAKINFSFLSLVFRSSFINMQIAKINIRKSKTI